MTISYGRGQYPRQQFYSTDIVQWRSAGTSGELPPPATVRRAIGQLLPRMARRRYLDEPCVTATFP